MVYIRFIFFIFPPLWGGLGWGFLFNFPIYDVEDFGGVGRFEDVGEVLTVGVSDKDLTEIIALHHLYDSFHPLAVEPVEDVIEEKDRLADVQSLCQFHGENEGTLLTLTADLLERILAQTHIKVIFVDTL